VGSSGHDVRVKISICFMSPGELKPKNHALGLRGAVHGDEDVAQRRRGGGGGSGGGSLGQ